MTELPGAFLTVAAGLTIGCGAWPVKVLRTFRFEHWWFTAMLVGLVVIPWTGTLLLCPHAIEAYRSVPAGVYLKANAFALAWGIANLLCGICLVRIGVGLSGAIVTGLGVALGAILPLVAKGTGLFANAPDITSRAGVMVVAGVAVMLLGVALVGVAGFGKDRAQSGKKTPSGGFVLSLVLCAIAGITSCGLSLCFVYAQGPIVAAMKARGAADMPANLAVWAAAIAAGALVNVIYPASLMTTNRSWNVLWRARSEICLAAVTGIQMMGGAVMMGKGMLMLGALGASVGFGIQQAAQIIGGQSVGFISGEWRGVPGKHKNQMLIAIGVLILAAAIMAYGNTL